MGDGYAEKLGPAVVRRVEMERNHDLMTYSALDTATILVCTSVSVRGRADTQVMAAISPDKDKRTYHDITFSC